MECKSTCIILWNTSSCHIHIHDIITIQCRDMGLRINIETHVSEPQTLIMNVHPETYYPHPNRGGGGGGGGYMYRKGTSIRQAPVFRHLRALRKSPLKFIIWMNEL